MFVFSSLPKLATATPRAMAMPSPIPIQVNLRPDLMSW
jgi:hypothetical protein